MRYKKIVVAIVAALGMFGLSPAITYGLTLSTARDCDANAVIHCGAISFTELKTRYQNAGVSTIYSFFGISAQDINNIDSTAGAGSVTKTGDVLVDGKVVATNAMTAGRQNIPGSTAVTKDGVTFYTRPPSVSFVSSPLAAFVVMQNNRFDFAIIASCGNPVIATPTTPVKPKVVTAPTVKPTQTQTVNVNTPATTVVQSAASSAPAQTLPNTGAGNVLGLAGATSTIGTLGHWYYSRRGRRSH